MAKQVRIVVDYGNNAATWWDAARAQVPCLCPVSCKALVFREHAVTVTAEDAGAFREWASALPGWSDGPGHAPYPFTFHDVE